MKERSPNPQLRARAYEERAPSHHVSPLADKAAAERVCSGPGIGGAETCGASEKRAGRPSVSGPIVGIFQSEGEIGHRRARRAAQRIGFRLHALFGTHENRKHL